MTYRVAFAFTVAALILMIANIASAATCTQGSDDPHYKFSLDYDASIEVNCNWLTKNAMKSSNRIGKYCVRGAVAYACSKTCGNPACTCADASENIKPITVMATGNEVSCSWLDRKGQDSPRTSRRKAMYCSSNDPTIADSRITQYCPSKCDVCNASPSVGAYISNLDPSKFNEVNLPICFDLTNGFTIAQGSASLVITNDGITTSVTAFEYNTLLGQLCTESGVATSDGKMDLEFRADTTSGQSIELLTSVVAGSSTVTVNLLADNGDVFTGIARVSAQSADISSVQAVADITDGSGYAVLTNIPSRTLIVSAQGGGNEAGFAGVVPDSPGISSSIDIIMTTFKAPSDIANNNFSQGTAGWLLPNDLIGAGGLEKVSIVAHDENVGPGQGSRRHRRRAQSSLIDNDLMVSTAGVEGQSSVSRTFNVADNITEVKVRYRFQTDEVPGGYYGSRWNDFFFINIRTAENDPFDSQPRVMAAMNDFQLNEFDQSTGEMAWKELSLVLPAVSPIVQVNVGVANVDDNLFDSSVYIDYITQVAGAYPSNMDENGFNGVGNPFCFSLQNQDDNFVRDSAQSPIKLLIRDNDGVAITVNEFVYDSALGQLCTTDDITTSTDSNGFVNTYTIELKATTLSGNDVDSNFVLYVGSITLTVNLRRFSDGNVYTDNVFVSLCSPYFGTCATEYHDNRSGNVVFRNVFPGPYKLNSGGYEKSFTLQSVGYSQSIDFAIE